MKIQSPLHRPPFPAVLAALMLAVAPPSMTLAEGAADKKHMNQAKTDPRLEACIKSVNLIGASMGHAERAGTESNPMLDFVVRANSGDYNIACEMKTGLVKDISPRLAGSPENE